MTVLIKNNAVAKIAGSVDATQTTITLETGSGDRFPSPTGDEWFPVTLEAISGGAVTREIAHCTGRSGDVLTVIRAREGTAGETFSAGDRAELRFTQGVFDMLAQITGQTGSVRIPSGTTAERDPTPGADKLLRFNTDTGLYEGYNGSQWVAVGAGATGGGGDQVFVENDQAVTQDYTIPANKNAMSTGPITINDSVTVTVSDGARWVII